MALTFYVDGQFLPEDEEDEAERILDPRRGIFFLTELPLDVYGSEEDEEDEEVKVDEDSDQMHEDRDESDEAEEPSMSKAEMKKRERDLKALKRSTKKDIRKYEGKMRKANRRHDQNLAECYSGILKNLYTEKQQIKESIRIQKEMYREATAAQHRQGLFGRIRQFVVQTFRH